MSSLSNEYVHLCILFYHYLSIRHWTRSQTSAPQRRLWTEATPTTLPCAPLRYIIQVRVVYNSEQKQTKQHREQSWTSARRQQPKKPSVEGYSALHLHLSNIPNKITITFSTSDMSKTVHSKYDSKLRHLVMQQSDKMHPNSNCQITDVPSKFRIWISNTSSQH
jgi:hypothetical protein